MQVIVHNTPFEHCLLSNWLTPAEELSVLNALERETQWRRQKEHFYTHSSIDLSQIEVSAEYGPLCSREKLSTLKLIMEKMFGIPFSNEIRVWMHKMVPGDGIGIHNDNCESELRMVLQLNRGWRTSNGGISVLLSKDGTHFLDRMYKPISNTAIAFLTTKTSYHAVTDVMEDTRFSIVYVLKRVN